jgi:2-methylcitrate dehydratase PrpD
MEDLGRLMAVAEELAEFVRTPGALKPSTSKAAIRAILDLLTAAIVGFPSKGGKAAFSAASHSWGSGRAACWFSETQLTASGAAFANSAMASMLDLDDGHRDAAGHPGAAIIPAVLAAADCQSCDAERLIMAICLGYEVGIRVSRARNFAELGTLASGLWTAHGVAAAIAFLQNLDTHQIANALAIAGTTAPNLSSIAHTAQMGNHVKEGIPWSTATGISAVDQAKAGFTGPVDFLDHESSFARTSLMDGLGSSWLIETIYFKPYSCCRWSHAAIDASLMLSASHNLTPNDLLRVDIDTFSRALRLNNDVEPTNLEAAQYSIPFTVALALLRGSRALLPLSERYLGDKEVSELARRIYLKVDPQLDDMFTARVPARVTITTKQGVFEKTVLDPKGEPTNPMDWDELVQKLHTVGVGLIGDASCERLVKSVRSLEKGDRLPLRRFLRQKIHSAPELVSGEWLC